MANEYLCSEADRRVDPLVQVCLKFGKTGKAPVSMIKKFAAAQESSIESKKASSKKRRESMDSPVEEKKEEVLDESSNEK